ncbi:hypothetical protein T484DRAFT_3485621 [Baffinella frigidus]|nr:hypothetical protein T484DRAFT_3485621 [Cryptophyta sp. CCMP2293]
MGRVLYGPLAAPCWSMQVDAMWAHVTMWSPVENRARHVRGSMWSVCGRRHSLFLGRRTCEKSKSCRVHAPVSFTCNETSVTARGASSCTRALHTANTSGETANTSGGTRRACPPGGLAGEHRPHDRGRCLDPEACLDPGCQRRALFGVQRRALHRARLASTRRDRRCHVPGTYRGASLITNCPPHRTTTGPPQGPRHRTAVGSQGCAVSYARGTPVSGQSVALARSDIRSGDDSAPPSLWG